MDTIEVKINLPEIDVADVEKLVAYLSSAGYQSFAEHESGILAYILAVDYDESIVDTLLAALLPGKRGVQKTVTIIEQKNWNEEWESNYPPVIIDDRVLIKAPFHSHIPSFEYVITLEPKMAFGTGHHETTTLMITALLTLNLKGLHVLDMGCGTGILAILAGMMGASSVTAIDIDEWAVQNAVDNCQLNTQPRISVIKGDCSCIPPKSYNLIMANINLNILLADLPTYVSHLNTSGQILFSGIYHTDFPLLHAAACDCGLGLSGRWDKKDWIAVLYVK